MAKKSRAENTCLLGDVISFRNDIVHPKDSPEGPATFVGLEHVEPHTGRRIGAESVLLENLTGRRARFRKNDIVYGYLRPYLNKVWLAEFDGICSVDQYVLSHTDRVDTKYLAHYLRSESFLAAAPIDTSPGQLPRIRSGELSSTPIPLPPLHEQRRLAATLDQADELRRKRRECLAKLDTLLSAAFFELFGDPIRNDRAWQRVPFETILNEIEGGWSPNCLDRPAGDTEWGVLKLGAVTYGRYDELEQKALPDGTPPRPELEVKSGDLLFTRKNTHALVAACALVRETRPRLLIPDLIFRLQLNRAMAHPEYVRALLSNSGKRKLIQNLASGAAGSMPNISKARLKTVAIELPPFELQAKFAAVAQTIDALRKKMLAESSHLGSLFASLQHRAFSGELTAQAAQREVAAAE